MAAHAIGPTEVDVDREPGRAIQVDERGAAVRGRQGRLQGRGCESVGLRDHPVEKLTAVRRQLASTPEVVGQPRFHRLTAATLELDLEHRVAAVAIAPYAGLVPVASALYVLVVERKALRVEVHRLVVEGAPAADVENSEFVREALQKRRQAGERKDVLELDARGQLGHRKHLLEAYGAAVGEVVREHGHGRADATAGGLSSELGTHTVAPLGCVGRTASSCGWTERGSR